jgi:hypothetical protein
MVKLAFYTGFFGGDSNWAKVVPPVPSTDYDAYYFTNNTDMYQRLAHTQWKRVWLNVPIHNDNVKDAMASKELRCCPERFAELQDYDFLCWMDSKMRVTEGAHFKEMLNHLMSTECCIAATHHPLPYKTVWDEYTTAIKYQKYASEKDSYKKYIEQQLEKGADPNKPQRICCGFRLMKMNARRKELGELWLSHIQECGIEDQISWQFVHQLFEEEIALFPYQHCWTPM